MKGWDYVPRVICRTTASRKMIILNAKLVRSGAGLDAYAAVGPRSQSCRARDYGRHRGIGPSRGKYREDTVRHVTTSGKSSGFGYTSRYKREGARAPNESLAGGVNCREGKL